MNPLILQNSWNHIEIVHKKTLFIYGNDTERADIIFYPGGYERWDWKRPKTFCKSHIPGVSKEAINYLIDKNCDYIIVSSGYGNENYTIDGKLCIQQEALDYAKNKVKLLYMKSEKAVTEYNKLVLENNYKVGMYMHSTC